MTFENDYKRLFSLGILIEQRKFNSNGFTVIAVYKFATIVGLVQLPVI